MTSDDLRRVADSWGTLDAAACRELERCLAAELDRVTVGDAAECAAWLVEAVSDLVGQLAVPTLCRGRSEVCRIATRTSKKRGSLWASAYMDTGLRPRRRAVGDPGLSILLAGCGVTTGLQPGKVRALCDPRSRARRLLPGAS